MQSDDSELSSSTRTTDITNYTSLVYLPPRNAPRGYHVNALRASAPASNNQSVRNTPPSYAVDYHDDHINDLRSSGLASNNWSTIAIRPPIAISPPTCPHSVVEFLAVSVHPMTQSQTCNLFCITTQFVNFHLSSSTKRSIDSIAMPVTSTQPLFIPQHRPGPNRLYAMVSPDNDKSGSESEWDDQISHSAATGRDTHGLASGFGQRQ